MLISRLKKCNNLFTTKLFFVMNFWDKNFPTVVKGLIFKGIVIKSNKISFGILFS